MYDGHYVGSTVISDRAGRLLVLSVSASGVRVSTIYLHVVSVDGAVTGRGGEEAVIAVVVQTVKRIPYYSLTLQCCGYIPTLTPVLHPTSDTSILCHNTAPPLRPPTCQGVIAIRGESEHT